MNETKSKAARQLTIFAMPAPAPRNPQGRPRYEKSEQDQLDTAWLVYLGYRQDEIAAVLGISIPTMRLNFSGISPWRDRWGTKSKFNKELAE